MPLSTILGSSSRLAAALPYFGDFQSTSDDEIAGHDATEQRVKIGNDCRHISP
jgi:hypothetical protein